MRKTVVAPLAVVGFGAVLALGFAVAALGSSSSVSGQVSTTTAPTSTTEENTTTKFVSKLGARVVTFHGFGGEMPSSFELVFGEVIGEGQLALWVKQPVGRRGRAPGRG